MLLAGHAGLAIDTLRQKSVTVDEVGHLPAGISYWQKGTFELYHHNPPLVKLLAALPALAAEPAVDYSKSWETNLKRGMPLSPWAFGWEFMYANAARYDAIYFWARLPIVALSVLAGVIIFVWARKLFGTAGGLTALALWTFCPNAIAHAGLVTTDIGATSIGFVATYFFWRWLRGSTWPRTAVAGVMLGLAELTKFSMLLLYGLFPVMWLCWIALRKPGAARGRSVGQFATMFVTSLLLINLGYGFEGTGTRLGDFPFLSRSLTRPRTALSPPPVVPQNHPWREVLIARQNRFLGSWLAHVPLPLPRHYIEGFDEQKLESEGIGGQGYPVYLCGELRRTGWWWYFFFALAVKVPLGTWLLTIVAVATCVLRPAARACLADELVLLIPPVAILLVMSFLTDINLGLRYVLPIFPFWFVLLGRVGVWFDAQQRDFLLLHKRRMSPFLLLAPLGWNLLACARAHPDHLAYFNELVGGPKHGHHYLLDSNLDWGQDLLPLARWLRANRPGEPVGLAYFGNVDPSILAARGEGFTFRLAPPAKLEDLVPLAVTSARLRPVIEVWGETHRTEVEAWLHANPHRKLGEMPGFRAIVADELGLSEGPQPGLFAVSANLLHGLPFRLRDHEGNLWDFARGPAGGSPDPFGYFRQLEPIGPPIGGSILIYELSPDRANSLRAQLGLPQLQSQTGEPARASTPDGSEP